MVIELRRAAAGINEETVLKYAQFRANLAFVNSELDRSILDFVHIAVSESKIEWTIDLADTDYAKCLAGWYSYDMQNEQLWNILPSTQEAIQVATTDEIINLGYVNFFSRSQIEQALICWHEAMSDPEVELELELVKRFKEVPEVQSIHADKYLDRKRFLILTSNEQYDNALMDQLLSIEQELRTSHAETVASFVYIPKLMESTDEIVSRDSKLIYERGYDVIFASPFMASGTEREASQATAW